jgi:hypothetical protein
VAGEGLRQFAGASLPITATDVASVEAAVVDEDAGGGALSRQVAGGIPTNRLNARLNAASDS